MSNFQPLEVVDRSSEIQSRVIENLNYLPLLNYLSFLILTIRQNEGYLNHQNAVL